MITYEIIKILSRRSEIKQLENGNGLLLIRLKTVLKSFLSRLRSVNFISPFGWQEKDHLSNQHRAPPTFNSLLFEREQGVDKDCHFPDQRKE